MKTKSCKITAHFKDKENVLPKIIKTLTVIMLLCSVSMAFLNEKKLGAWYEVKKDNTQFVVMNGGSDEQQLNAGDRVRLIKDDAVMEQLVMAPFRVIQLIFLKTPRGTWLVEDEQGNRGYVWNTEVVLAEKRQ